MIRALIVSMLFSFCMTLSASTTTPTFTTYNGNLQKALSARLSAEPAEPDKAQKKEIAALNKALKALEKAPKDIVADMKTFASVCKTIQAAFPSDAAFAPVIEGTMDMFSGAVLFKLGLAQSDAADVTDKKSMEALKKLNDKAAALIEHFSHTAVVADVIKDLLALDKLTADIDKVVAKAQKGDGATGAKHHMDATVSTGTNFNSDNAGLYNLAYSPGGDQILSVLGFQNRTDTDYDQIRINIYNPTIGEFPVGTDNAPPGDQRTTKVTASFQSNYPGGFVWGYSATGTVNIKNVNFAKGTIEMEFTLHCTHTFSLVDTGKRPDIDISNGYVIDTIGGNPPDNPNKQ